MNRQLWKKSFAKTHLPAWPCPACKTGRLLTDLNTFSEGETAESAKSHNDEYWELSWIAGQFVCLLKCRDCSETVAMAGRYSIEEWSDHEGNNTIQEDYLHPMFLMEAPHIIYLPESLPPDIEHEMRKSFQLYWVNINSCANRIRSSIEMLLTHQEMNSVTTDQNANSSHLPLHQRIQSLEKINKILADHLMAIKWIGNAGSHTNSLVADDILDVYVIMEQVFEQLFEQKAQKVAELCSEINRHKKPRSAKYQQNQGF